MSLRMNPGLRVRLFAIADRARAWRRAEGGVAAVEFALVLPIMVTLFFGLSETTLAVNIDRKLTLLSRSLADLSSRTAEITSTDMSTIFTASTAVMRPYDATKTQMVVSSVIVTQSGQTYTGAVEWSCPKNITAKAQGQTQTDYDATNLKARAKNSSYAVPIGFQTPTTKSFILVETLMPFVPTFGQVITGTIQLRETTPWPVRNTDKVKGPSSCP